MTVLTTFEMTAYIQPKPTLPLANSQATHFEPAAHGDVCCDGVCVIVCDGTHRSNQVHEAAGETDPAGCHIFLWRCAGQPSSLKYIPISFHQAIGSTTPLFTAILAVTLQGVTWLGVGASDDGGVDVLGDLAGVQAAPGKRLVQVHEHPACMACTHKLVNVDAMLDLNFCECSTGSDAYTCRLL